ncbi:protein CHUP1, chloroplastic-like isoform X2 [Gastrolobium bilobum]|uniref:protein CHUP1, chloroplastic-like isoform X2 n=1 Tax=Gastrolobium bilobum TaxID=150636 RepID=UPI002AB308AF|nr:protein CHUP1, chloroplastic-like isoform X2 [Gastrolobium bilobum]
MVIREEMGMKPILLNFGLALAISFAGFLYSRLRTSKTKPSTDSHTGSPSDHGNEVNLGGGTGEALNTCNTVSEGNFLYAEETCIDRAISDNFPTGLSPSSKQNEEKDEFLLPEFNDIVKEVDLGATIVGNFFKKDLEAPRLKVGSSISCADPEKDDHEQEIRQLRNMIRMLQDREQSLEVQLLEYYGLREEETAVMELQNRLKISNMEAKMFNLKVKTLQSENLRLEKEVADHAKVLAELEAAEAKVKLLKRKIRYEAERNREKIITLQQRVSKLQDQECKDVASDQDIQIKLQKLKGLESEAEELRKSNLKLQIENSDLARRLDSTQMLANAVLGDTDVADAMKQENERLRQDNEALMKKIEQLQCDRCSDLEELVYMRWINACLRYELRNYQPPLGKTVAKDLSKSLSPTSEKKAKQLILEYANTDEQGSIVDFDLDQWSSSQASFLTDSGDCDVFSSVDNSSAARTNATSQTKIFSKLRRLILGKDSHYHHSEVSLHEKSGYQQDGNSPGLSTSPRTSTFTSRTSFDFSRLTSMKEGDTTDSLAIEKSNLEKYAEALKDSSASAKHQRRRRSASYS